MPKPWNQRDPSTYARVLCPQCGRRTTLEIGEFHSQCDAHGEAGGNDSIWICPGCLTKGDICDDGIEAQIQQADVAEEDP